MSGPFLLSSISRLDKALVFPRQCQFSPRDMFKVCLDYRTMPGPCYDHVGTMFSLALDEDYQDWVNLVQGTGSWSVKFLGP